MYSPYKLCDFEQNSFEISENFELANELSSFFSNPTNNYLWSISTIRQKVTHALRHTEAIHIRNLAPTGNPKTTDEWNQVLETKTTQIADIPIFKKTIQWLEESLLNTGATNIEFGRIFFSKHHAGTDIDEHVDAGKYFSYYDRFHYVVDQQNGENIFHIRNEDVLLETGKLYWVNNHVPHWLKNKSSKDRINLIFDARLT